MIPKITDGELKILEALWQKYPVAASEIVGVLKETNQWNRNTTYTFINRLVEKGVIKREEPGFICTPLYTQEQIRVSEARTFLDKMYEGSLKVLVTSFLHNDALTEKELNELKQLIQEKDQA